MDESDASKYWCHVCTQVVNPIMENEMRKCPICQSGFVEEMASSAATPEIETPFDFGFGGSDLLRAPHAHRAHFIWAPISELPNRGSLLRRIEFDWDDGSGRQLAEFDRELESLSFDYSMDPDFDLFLPHLAENDPNIYGPPPAQKEAVEALPTVKLEESTQCCVCLDECDIGCEVREMPCKHKFHSECILSWLELHNSCPLCRHQLPSVDSKIDNLEGLINNVRQESQNDSRIGEDLYHSVIEFPFGWGFSGWFSDSLSTIENSFTMSPFVSMNNSSQDGQNRCRIGGEVRDDNGRLFSVSPWEWDFSSWLFDSQSISENSSATSPFMFMNNSSREGQNHNRIGGEDRNDSRRQFSVCPWDLGSLFFGLQSSNGNSSTISPTRKSRNPPWSTNERHLPSETYGTFSSLFWTQMYKLDVSYIDNSIPRDADIDARNSFLSPAAPSIAIRPIGCDDVVGGSIYDPTCFSSLFEKGRDDKYLVGIADA